MDLALQFGFPSASRLKKSISECDLQQWMAYARDHGMPRQRLEMYMAQIALWIARGPVQGAENMTLQDFMFTTKDGRTEEYDGDDIVADAREAFGFSPKTGVE